MFPLRTSVPVREVPVAVIALILANVAVYLVQRQLPPDQTAAFLWNYALVPARFGYEGVTAGTLLAIVTNTFMHGGLLHIAVNMWTLWLFGRALEEAFGTAWFIAFYLACGAIASLAHLAFNLGSTIPALGASGAIAGVLGGFTLLFPRARIVLVVPVLVFPFFFTLPAAVFTAFWFAFQILPGLAELDAARPRAGIAWWAHVGGLVAGLALAWLILRLRRERRDRQRRIRRADAGFARDGHPREGALGNLRAGRRYDSLSAHRPMIIEVGDQRDEALNAGIARPRVIRFGRSRRQEAPPDRTAMSPAGRVAAAPSGRAVESSSGHAAESSSDRAAEGPDPHTPRQPWSRVHAPKSPAPERLAAVPSTPAPRRRSRGRTSVPVTHAGSTPDP